MHKESRELHCDILAPCDVVVLLDGTPTPVCDAIYNDDSLKTVNFRLLAFAPEELANPTSVRGRIQQAIASIAAGTFDAMFSQAASLSGEGGTTRLTAAANIRNASIAHLQHLLDDESALSGMIQLAKDEVIRATERGFKTITATDRENAANYLTSSRSPLTTSMDHLFTAERIPFLQVAPNDHAYAALCDKHRGILRPSDAAHVYLSQDILNYKQNATNILPLTFSQVVFDQLTSRKLGLLAEGEIDAIGGNDPTKVRYATDKKRREVSSYNKSASSPILMFPDAMQTARRNAMSPGLVLETTGSTSRLAELHHLHTYYTDEAQKKIIRNRFDQASDHYANVMHTLDERISERLEAARLPSDTSLNGRSSDVAPLTSEEAILRADRFARSSLPEHYRLRSYLQPTTDHAIALRLTNDAGETVERTIRLAEPDTERALDIKRRVQAHLLDLPGIVPYRGPMKEGKHHVAVDEFIPSPGADARIGARYGEYRLILDWPNRSEEITIPLGVQYAAENHAEAVQRAEYVRQLIDTVRQDHPGHEHLPITKRDIIDHLRQHVERIGGKWDERERKEIDDFPHTMKFPFSDRASKQESWLEIGTLYADGDPNYTWVLPIHVVVNGQRLANASTCVNLHVRDRDAAEHRAIETVNCMMQQLGNLPHNAQWCVDPERSTHLASLTESARKASPHLIDTNILKDFQNELRSPFQKDLSVQAVGTPVEKGGRLSFSLGVFRGGADGLREPVLRKTGDDKLPPESVVQNFSIAKEQAQGIMPFADAVNRTFREVIAEEYDPRSSRNYDSEHLRKLKAPRPFNPGFAPKVFDRAITTHIARFGDIEAIDLHAQRSGTMRQHGGFANIVSQSATRPSFPN